jgi:hypothetical protein
MKIRKIIAERPANIPNTWTIMNAPRPLWGTRAWQGDFISGIFYVALDPASVSYQDHYDYNQSQDATILEYVSQQDVVDEMIAYYKAQPKLWERLKYHDFTNSDIQKELVQTWFNLGKNWSEE